MNKRTVWITLLILVLAIGFVAIVEKKNAKEDAVQLVSVPSPQAQQQTDTIRYPVGATQLSMIQVQSLPSSRVPLSDALNARVAYNEDVTVRLNVGISGRITSIKVSPGSKVKIGQVLTEIDSPDVGTATADLNKAKADEHRKYLALERAKSLGIGEAISSKEWESLQADWIQARAETARAEQKLKNLNPHGLIIKGQRVLLTSPMSGVVTERTATPALEVSPGMSSPLFVITDPKKLWLFIDLPENLIGHIKVGSTVQVESDAFPDERFSAEVVELGQMIDATTRRATIRALLKNPEGKLLPEMFVRAYVLQSNGIGVRVPNNALVNRGIYMYVFVEISPNVFKLQKITLQTRGSDFSFVSEGLKGGERIVINGALLLDAELAARTGG